MKIVIAGGAGRIGSRIARALDDQGYSVVVASPRHGIDALTGRGLAEAFANADVVIDTMNLPAAIPYSEAENFFGAATTNLLRAGEAAGGGAVGGQVFRVRPGLRAAALHGADRAVAGGRLRRGVRLVR